MLLEKHTATKVEHAFSLGDVADLPLKTPKKRPSSPLGAPNSAFQRWRKPLVQVQHGPFKPTFASPFRKLVGVSSRIFFHDTRACVFPHDLCICHLRPV